LLLVIACFPCKLLLFLMFCGHLKRRYQQYECIVKWYSEYLLFAAQVIEGYEKACKKALEILPDLVCCSAKNLRDIEEVASLLHTSVMSKQYGNESFLAKLIAQACGKWTRQMCACI